MASSSIRPETQCRSNLFKLILRRMFFPCSRPILGSSFGPNSWNGTSRNKIAHLPGMVAPVRLGAASVGRERCDPTSKRTRACIVSVRHRGLRKRNELLSQLVARNFFSFDGFKNASLFQKRLSARALRLDARSGTPGEEEETPCTARTYSCPASLFL